ncbi:MAG TPA: carboxymuconolactone decarboxylase family protein [Methylomirabilota bacterium]|nr:carboxymuconolactone decarboxylase family protein [Methylomirabilota bacterium]
MVSALEHVAWEPCVLELHRDRTLESYARKRQGIPNPAIGYFAPVPWLARALIDLHPEYGLLMRLDHDVMDLVALAVSQENSCRFCYAAVRAMLWAQGMSRARIQRIEQDLARADLSPRAVAAMAFGRSQSRSGPVGARAARDALRQAGIDADEMREIAYAVALTDFSNRAYTIPAIPARPIERMPDQLHMRLLRPLLNRLLRRSRYPGRPTALEPVPPSPYSRLVQAYAGSPIATAVARTLEDMWASPHLTRRCKLLMLAVVARGLACEACAPEISEALQREGVTEATLARVLTHLDAPELDPAERLLVPFARETIWYEPAPMQRRTRLLRERLSGPQLVEAIGVASLANGLCRMGAMVLDPA